MTGQEDQVYEAFIDLLAGILLEQLSAETAVAEKRGSNGQNEA